MQYINISVVILLVNFNLDTIVKKYDKLFGVIPILDGDYNDFSV